MWDQFEPTQGNYNETAFDLLDTFLGWIEERELVAHGTLSPFYFPLSFHPNYFITFSVTFCWLDEWRIFLALMERKYGTIC